MNKTVFKPLTEIEAIFKPHDRIAILSCGTCAMLSGTGGSAGMRQLQRWLKDWNKQTTMAHCVAACCPEEIMRQSLRIFRKSIAQSDALVVLACAAGIKSAFLCRPPIPVLTILDPVGSVAISHDADPIAQSICTACGHCVLNWTGGICPLSHCPAHMKYGPCPKAPRNGGPCVVDAGRECIWTVIARRGDLDGLLKIKDLHKQRHLERPAPVVSRRAPASIRRFSGWAAARFQVFEKIVHLID